jgi:hypothetical protein
MKRISLLIIVINSALAVLFLGLSMTVFVGCKSLASAKPSIVGINPDADANLLKMQGEINGLKEANIRLSGKLDLMNQMQAGWNNKIESLSVGRDNYQTITNDSSLMKYIIEIQGKAMKGMAGIIMALILYGFKERMARMKTDDKFMTALLQVAVKSENQRDFDEFMSKQKEILNNKTLINKIAKQTQSIFQKKESEKNV